MSNMHNILEKMRRNMIDAVADRIAEHGLKVIRSDVGTHPKYGLQLIIIIQATEAATKEEENDGR